MVLDSVLILFVNLSKVSFLSENTETRRILMQNLVIFISSRVEQILEYWRESYSKEQLVEVSIINNIILYLGESFHCHLFARSKVI